MKFPDISTTIASLRFSEKLQLASGTEPIEHNMYRCYEALALAGIVPKQEISLVEAWINDLGVSRRKTTELARDVESSPI